MSETKAYNRAFKDLKEPHNYRVKGTVTRLLEKHSCWFAVTPLPDGYWEISVKPEMKAALDRILDEELPWAGCGSMGEPTREPTCSEEEVVDDESRSNGGRVVTYDGQERCSRCKGSGRVEDDAFRHDTTTCPDCDGSGRK
jgi:hypothetical protein